MSLWVLFTLAAAALGCVRPGSAVGGDRQTSAAAAPVRSSEAVTAAGSGTATFDEVVTTSCAPSAGGSGVWARILPGSAPCP